jgi:hypothetical protein
MKPAMKRDLIDLSDILEGFALKLDKLTGADLIDLAARLKPVAKHCEAIDKFAKLYVKDKRNGVDGEVLGGEFKAVLKGVSTTRLNQQALREGDPKIHAKYNESVVDERVSFELR